MSMVNRLVSLFVLVGVVFTILAVAACSRSEPPPTPVTITSEPTAKPTAEPAPTKGALFNLVFDGRHYRFVLTEYQRKPNPDREGWDVVDAKFVQYVRDRDPEGTYRHRRLQRETGGRVSLEWELHHHMDFGLRLVWDGGQGGGVVPDEDEYVRHLRPIELAFKADLPTVARGVQIEAYTNEEAYTRRVNEMGWLTEAGRRPTDHADPMVWAPDALASFYRTDVAGGSVMTSIDHEADETVKYVDLGRSIQGGLLLWELEIENLSMQDDLDLSACISPEGFLDAFGREVTAVGGYPACFEWEKPVLPPAFKARGRLELRVPPNVGQATYVDAKFEMPGMNGRRYLLQLPSSEDIKDPTVASPTSQLDLSSPPGRMAFVSDRDGNWNIYVMNADGSGVTRLTNDHAADLAPSWSPDGQRIAFVSDRDGNSGIYVMNADGSGVTRLTNEHAADLAPSWSPDGQQIAFVSDRDKGQELYVMNADGSGVSRRTKLEGAVHSPSWSPDGQRIAFGYTLYGRHWSIRVIDVDGPNITNLSEGETIDRFPSWSPDGQQIAFGSIRDGNWNMYVMNADGSGVTRLTDSKEGRHSVYARPSWSPDGRYISFQSNKDWGDWNIYIMRHDGIGVTRLTDDLGNGGNPDWTSP